MEIEKLAKNETASNAPIKMPPGAYRRVLAIVEHPISCEPVGTDCCEMTFGLPSGAYATTLMATLSANEEYL